MVFYYIYLSPISSSSEPIDFIPGSRALFSHIDVFAEQPERFTGKLHARHDSRNPKRSVVTARKKKREGRRGSGEGGREERSGGRWGGGGKKERKRMMKSSFMLYILCMKISDPESRCYCVERRKEDPRLSRLVCELTFFMDTDSTGTPETAVYSRCAAYIVLSSRSVGREI